MVESAFDVSYTVHVKLDLNANTPISSRSGSLGPGPNIVVIPGSLYAWPQPKAFFHITVP